MTERISLPRATAILVDGALMDLSDAARMVEPLLRHEDIDVVRRSGLAMIKIFRAVEKLKEAPRSYQERREVKKSRSQEVDQ